MTKRPVFVISLIIICCGILAYATGIFFLDIIELKTIDFRFRARGAVTPQADVVLAVIDEKSLDQEGKWVWPRSKLATLVDKLSDGGARVIAFDIGFHEPDDQRVARAIDRIESDLVDFGLAASRLEAYFNRLKADSDNDRRLAEAIARSRARVVLGWFFHMDADVDGIRHLAPEQIKRYEGRLRAARYAFTRSDFSVEPALEYIFRMAPEPNIELVADAADRAGYFNFIPDHDGVIRWLPAVLQFNDNLYAPLSMMALSAYWDTPLHLDIGEYGEVLAVCIGDRHCIPTDENGRLMVNYRGPENTFPYLSVTDILHDRIAADAVQDKIVIVGATATGTYDLKVTPYSTTFPGPEIHANIVDSVLAGDFLEQPGYFRLLDVLAILLAGLSLSAALSRFGMVGGALTAVAFVVGYATLTVLLFTVAGIVLNLVYPFLVMMGIYVVSTAFKYFVEEGEKRFIRSTFSKYLAPTVVQQLIESPEKIELGGEQREITAFFSDVQGFTGISESLSPSALVDLLNEFLTEMTDIILRHEGTVDKFEGDAIIAFFGAPFTLANHGLTATQACVDMQQRMNVLREQWRAAGKPALNMRIGLCSGPAVVGNMGSRNRMDYTMMGDTVNIAARLEGVNKVYGTYTLISDTTRHMLDDTILLREIDRIRVVGRKEPITVYEPLGRRGEDDSDRLRLINRYADGLAAYRAQQWRQGQEIFQQLLTFAPGDGPAKAMLARCRDYAVAPPPADWDGAFALTTK